MKSSTLLTTLLATLPSTLATPLTKRAGIAPGVPLRILPVGGSITAGHQSTHSNGYRLDLLNSLTSSGSKNITYLGQNHDGNFTNDANDGWPGRVIDQIASLSAPDFPKKPYANIVLLHAGTNDLNQANHTTEFYDGAPARLATLIDEILHADPTTTLLVAQILFAANKTVAARMQKFDEQIPALVDARAKKGYKVLTVDMRGISSKYLADGLHPNDEGYAMMSEVWYKGLQTASGKGWIVAPK